MSFVTVRGLGSPRYGKKAVALINQRIAKFGSIRAYYDHVNQVNKSEHQKPNSRPAH